MYRFLLTPRWWGINLFAVLAVPFCLFMGSWQLSRFETRVDAHQQQEQEAEDHAQARAEPLEELLPVTTETSGRIAEAEGRYDREHPLIVPGREVQDDDGRVRSGFYVLSLLRTDSGKALPVVRGWVPGKPDPDRVPEAPTGEVTVTGALQAPESPRSPGVDASGLPEGQIGMLSAASLVNIVPYDVHNAWITVQDPAGGDEVLEPVPPAAPENTGLDMKAFQNLGYTAEWFVFAGFVVFMWFRFFRREVEVARDAELGLLPDDSGDSGGPGDGGDASGPTVAAAEDTAAATGEAPSRSGTGDAGAQPEDDGARNPSPASTA